VTGRENPCQQRTRRTVKARLNRPGKGPGVTPALSATRPVPVPSCQWVPMLELARDMRHYAVIKDQITALRRHDA
jgi:hypothetical protein